MMISTPDLCDQYGDQVQVADPVFKHYGGVRRFGGEVLTVKCFEDNSKVAELVKTPGQGRVLVVDGGGSPRRSLLGDNLARAAQQNGWSGIVIYGSIRDVEDITEMAIGVMALATIPLKTEKRNQGDVGVELAMAGLKIKSGSFLYADGSGVIVSDQSLL
ncbi:ribonuclease E activity regulator RraA [Oceanicoccus sp. KOV_DT_Chl]|uniref:ribonuclease E activity regulator RraA n=1 Tax=Oceanicoccus sp. KOV_DT_Chl TaxID=1904639 RepID=UPI000C7E6B5F|nr:ribonuclease E activity regulator RraA [Oceanicoccus sp. KOV_DT_Chl]